MAITDGTSLDEQIFGSSEDDVLSGLGGQDTLWGFAGDDIIDAGEGRNEVLYGGRGNDILVGKLTDAAGYAGGDGRDILDFTRAADPVGTTFHLTNDTGYIGDEIVEATVIFYFSGIERFYGTDLNDEINQLGNIASVHGRGGDDVLIGDYRDNKLYGNVGLDTLRGGDGDDKLFGGSGEDLLKGGNDDDRLAGGGGSDYLRGGRGDDLLKGAGADDLLFGGLGDDRLKGGAGADGFVFYPGEGSDVVQDFDDGEGDLIYVPHFADFPESFDALLNRASTKNGNTLIELDGDAVLRINGVTKAELDESWFVFENFVLEIL